MRTPSSARADGPTAAQHAKEAALHRFIEHLLASEAGPLVGKITAFGSVARRSARRESDIDVLVFATADQRRVMACATEASFRTSLETGEYVGPLVYCLDRFRHPRTPFLLGALREGREVHTMGDKELRRAEASGYLGLARAYRRGAGHALRTGDHRIAVDAGYNAAELCAKGLLLMQPGARLPRSHGGIVGEFGRLVVLKGRVPKELGRELHACLTIRHVARYEPHGDIGAGEARRVLRLASRMIRALDAALGAMDEL